MTQQSEKWSWMMDYCKGKKIPPAQKWAWDEAEQKYNEEHYGKDCIVDVSHCGLTETEHIERERLLELQKSRTRWFSQQEFERLRELTDISKESKKKIMNNLGYSSNSLDG